MTANFARIMDPERREHFVYRAFDADGALLYVGCSYNPEKRLREHKYTSQWYTLAARFKLSGPYNYQTARRLEWEAIQTEDPLHNGQSPRNDGARRASAKAFSRVFNAALEHGASLSEAGRLARLALDSEKSAAS